MGNKEQAMSKAEEIFIALGAKPLNQVTGDDMPVLKEKSTRNTEDITDLASAEGEVDGWLNSVPHRQVSPESNLQDTDSLNSYLVLPAPSQEQVTEEQVAEDQAAEDAEDTGTYPDNPFEISLIVPDHDAFGGESLEEQLRYTGSGGYSKEPPMPGLAPSEGLAGLRRRHTDVFNSHPDPAPDPVLQSDISFEQLDRQETVHAFSQQTALPDNQPLLSNAQQLRLPTQAPDSVRIPPTWTKTKPTHKGQRRSKMMVIFACLALVGVLAALWLMNLPQPSSQQSTAQTPGISTPTSVIATPSQEVRATSTAHATSTPKAKPTLSPTAPPVRATQPPKPTSPPVSPMLYKYSFESGGTDSWSNGHNISLVQNSTTIAKDGSHSLKVTFNSSSNSDYPYVVATQLPSALRAGQTVTAYVYAAAGSNVQAKLYIQDQNLTWFDPGWTALDTLPIGSWHQLRFTLPSEATGSAARVGVQFYGYDTVAYIDVVTW